MEVIREIIEDINRLIDVEKIEMSDIRLGVFYTGVKLKTGHGGVSYTPVHELPDTVCCPKASKKMPNAGNLLNYRTSELLNYALDNNPLKSAIGVATMNALSNLIMENGYKGYKIWEYKDALDLVSIKETDRVVMIGAFPPFIRKITGYTKNIKVIERDPRAFLRGEGVPVYSEEEGKKIIPEADILIITGVTLVNHTIDGILDLVKSAREVIIVGPTASMIPDALFRRGVTIVAGVRIFDADRMLRIVGEGGAGYDFFEDCGHKIAIKKGEGYV